MANDRFDIAIIGGGIGGATSACHLAPNHSVILLEQENELAYHTTSRSAAVYLEHDGGFVFHRLNRSARQFLDEDHPELDAPLLHPMPVLDVGTEELEDQMREVAARGAELNPAIRFVAGEELTEICPVLRPDVAVIGVLEPTAAALDVMALHQLYVRRARAANAEIRRSSKVTGVTRSNDGFTLATASGQVHAGIVVNAAGAWGDVVAAMAGVQPIGLTPMRRTAFTTSVGQETKGWPLVYAATISHQCYFKPEAGNQLLCSLADETPSPPVDARPEEVDVAMAIENINLLTTLDIRSVNTAWAGLRTFSPDRDPVFGWDDEVEGFFWMVGQGGWGIVSSPMAGQVVANAVAGNSFPSALSDIGLTAEHLNPRR